jgi:hypothetical protein
LGFGDCRSAASAVKVESSPDVMANDESIAPLSAPIIPETDEKIYLYRVRRACDVRARRLLIVPSDLRMRVAFTESLQLINTGLCSAKSEFSL